MVKRTRKNPSRTPHGKPAARRVMVAKETDTASIDALFDDFARNLARKITRANASPPARKNNP